MGEIKSTLDLVMERTRHLSLTDEEKARQRTADYEQRLQGFLQQYADGALRLAELQNRVAELQAEMQIEDRQMVVAGVIGRIDPDGDNAPWLALLGQVAPEICEPLQNILEDHHLKQTDILAAGEQGQLERLDREHGISGSAVVPDSGADPVCRQQLTALSEATRARFEALLDQISV